LGGTALEFERRLERCSRPPPARPPAEFSHFKLKAPPEVIMDARGDRPFEILVKNGKGEQRLLDVRKFFDARSKYLIFGSGNMEIAAIKARHLFDIQRKFNDKALFNELLDIVEKLMKVKNGTAASLEFLQSIAMESGVEWKKEAIVKTMPAFTSHSIMDSFGLFGEIGEKTIAAAARQIVELGYRLKDRDVIEKIGGVIVALNRKFGFYSTYDYRANLIGIAKNEKIQDENRAFIANAVSDHILNLAIGGEKDAEEKIELFNRSVSAALLHSEAPETIILEACKIPADYSFVSKYLKDRAGKEPEAAVRELFAKLAYEFDIDDSKAEGYAESVLALESGLLNKASEAVAFAMAAGGEERAEEMAESVIGRIKRLPAPALSGFLRDFSAFARTHFNADEIKKECNDTKWNEVKVTEKIE